jgi:hypothetical protein
VPVVMVLLPLSIAKEILALVDLECQEW